MKLFKKLMSAVMVGVLSLAMMTGCSGGGADPIPPESPKPSDQQSRNAYYMLMSACESNGLKKPTYNEELSAIAQEYLDNYIAKNADKTITSTELNNRNKETHAKIQTMTTLNVLYPTSGQPKMIVGAFEYLSDQGGSRSTLQSAIVDWGCNYVGIAAKKASNGITYMSIVFVKAEAAQ